MFHFVLGYKTEKKKRKKSGLKNTNADLAPTPKCSFRKQLITKKIVNVKVDHY